MSSANEIINSLNKEIRLLDQYGEPTGVGATITDTIVYQNAVAQDNGEYIIEQVETENPVKSPEVLESGRVKELRERIDAYEDSAAILDRKILETNETINFKKSQIVSVVSTAVGAGCSYIYAIPSASIPLTISSVSIGFGRTVYNDESKYQIYDNLSNYSAVNPWDPDSTYTLSAATVGSGYKTITTNNSGTNIGIAGTLPGTLLAGGASSTCAGYASSVSSLLTEISQLRTQRDSYLTDINLLKSGKTDEELLYWGEKNSQVKRDLVKTNTQNLANNIASISEFGIGGENSIVKDGLLLWLDAGDTNSYSGIGTNWIDLSGRNNHAYNENMTFSNTEGGGTFIFNDSTSVGIITSYESLNYPRNGLTIESWVQFTGNNSDFIFEKGDVNSQYSLFSHNTDIVFRTYHEPRGGAYHSQTVDPRTSIGILNDTWHHIVGSWDGTTKRIYVDGILKNSVAKSGDLLTNETGSAVGRFGGTSTGYYFGGYIAIVRVYQKGLSGPEILQNYNFSKTRFGKG